MDRTRFSWDAARALAAAAVGSLGGERQHGSGRCRHTEPAGRLGLFAAFPNEFLLLLPGAVQSVQLAQLAREVLLPKQKQSFVSVAAWRSRKPVGGRGVASGRQRVHRAHIPQSCRGRSRWLSGRTLSLASSKVSQVRL